MNSEVKCDRRGRRRCLKVEIMMRGEGEGVE